MKDRHDEEHVGVWVGVRVVDDVFVILFHHQVPGVQVHFTARRQYSVFG